MEISPAALVILLLAMGLSQLFKRNFEDTAAFASVASMLVVFGFACISRLNLGVYLLVALAGASLVWCVWLAFRGRFDHRLLLRPSLVVFAVLAVGFSLSTKGCLVTYWDDADQWALAVKNSVALNRPPLGSRSNKLYFADYPPGAAMFLAFWELLLPRYQDYQLFAGMAVLTLTLLLPLVNVSFRQPWRALLSAVAVVALPYAMYREPYAVLQVDAAVGCAFGLMLLCLWRSSRERGWFDTIFLCLLAACMALLKKNGVLFVALALVIGALSRGRQGGKGRWRDLLLALLSAACAYAAWKLLVRYTHAYLTWQVTPKALLDTLTSMPDYMREGIVHYFRAIINCNALANPGHITFYLWRLPVPIAAWMAVCALLMLWAVRLCKGSKRWCIALFCVCVAYTAGVSLFYTQLGEGEIAILSSFNRYLGTAWLGALLFALGVIASEWRQTRGAIAYQTAGVLAALTILANVPWPNSAFGVLAPQRRQAMEQTYQANQQLQAYIEQLRPELQTEDLLCVANSGETMGDSHYFNYVLTPYRVGISNWSVNTFEDFLTTCESRRYTKLFLDKRAAHQSFEADAFAARYGQYFADEIRDRGLYAVEYETGQPRLTLLRVLDEL